ncbi:MAG: metal-sensing transcriptional repressor [Rubrobacteridae bacterium]|nr:metal-sensing transcriptional repressor [Rubrobacteridae bacterium]
MYDRDEEIKRVVTRLKRLEGQLRGLQRLIEMGEDCESILLRKHFNPICSSKRSIPAGW